MKFRSRTVNYIVSAYAFFCIYNEKIILKTVCNTCEQFTSFARPIVGYIVSIQQPLFKDIVTTEIFSWPSSFLQAFDWYSQ